MTRSLPFHPRAAVTVLLFVLLAPACGGGGEATAPSSSAAGAVGSAATLPEPGGSSATVGAPTPSAPTTATTATATTATTVEPVTAPSSTVRPASTATAITAGTVTTAPPTGHSLAGTVTASPTCPVERPDQPCPPRPVAGAHIEAFDRSERLVTSTDADAEGRFALTLAPGRYVVTASAGAVFPSCPPLTVEVPTSGETRADIACDTGIR